MRTRPSTPSTLPWLAVAFLALLLAWTPSFAQDDAIPDEADEEEQAAKHFAEGRKLYAEGKHKEAIDALLKAYTLRPAPPILLNIGRTYEKLDEKKKALEYYQRFLEKARLVDPNRKVVEKLVRKLEQETGIRVTGVGAGADTPDAARTAEDAGGGARTEQMIHTPVDSAKVRESIVVSAELPPQVGADKVWVHFRKAGERDFRTLEMAPQGDAFVVRIPGKHVTSTSLQYFIEATRAGQKRGVARAGTRSTPHIVVIEGGRAPSAGAVEIRSPYRTWIWVSAAGTAAFIGGTIAMAVMASDRASAVEVAAEKPEAFDARARAWESEGKTFAAMGKLFLGVGIAAAGATAYLWYRDRKYLREQREALTASGHGPIRSVRFSGGPWASDTGGGFVGRIDF